MTILDYLLVGSTLAAGAWWALSRHRRPAALQRLSLAAPALAAATLVIEGPRWQLVPWRVLAVAVAVAAARRHRWPGRSRRPLRVFGRAAIAAGTLAGGVALLTAFVPSLPEPTGPHRVGSQIFRWTDAARAETLTADPGDRRQVVAQAWYPADADGDRAVPYLEAQGRLPASVGGLPSFVYASFGEVVTHATFGAPVSSDRRAWPVLVFSSGLSVPREAYTALCADLASRGFVVVALSTPYESAPTVLAGGRVVGQTAHPDLMGPPPHPELERLIDIRSADARFALDALSSLSGSPLAGHLDLRHVGIAGHSLGGATAVQTMAADARFKVGVNLDGKLFGAQPDARLEQPLLWIQSDGPKTSEYETGRDRLLGRLRGRGSLVTIAGATHMSFSDQPAYLTAVGRSLIGAATGVGTRSAADMTARTADAIAAFVGPALGVA